MARNNQQRQLIELLRSRITLLKGNDRVLMTMYLDNENSFRQIAKLTGLAESTIARRIRRITYRLLNNYYLICLQERDKFTRAQLAIAQDYFIRGLPMIKIAAKRNYSYYYVRKTIRKIRVAFQNRRSSFVTCSTDNRTPSYQNTQDNFNRKRIAQ